MNEKRNGLTYAQAGVDVDAGNRMVERIKPLVRATARPGPDPELGGFGGLFDLKRAGTDGVGTRVMIAIETGRHETIGIDLVAMSVNDLVVQGAEPLFFLDYFACGKLVPEVGAQVVKGVARGCREAHCALIGGEMAEMPGLYKAGDYDLAGFSVGAVERDAVLPRGVAAGDVVLGLATGGIAESEMLRTFNCGVGMIAVVSPAKADAVAAVLTREGESVMRLGEVVARADAPRVIYDGHLALS